MHKSRQEDAEMSLNSSFHWSTWFAKRMQYLSPSFSRSWVDLIKAMA